MRVLALDVGERRIGLAISDPDGRLAVPLDTLERHDEAADLSALTGLVQREGVAMVVVGLPLSLDGTVGPQAARTQAFARRLAEAVARPLELWDERLSTVAARRSLAGGPPERRTRSGGRRRPLRRQRGVADAMAAAIILQGFLDSRSRRTPSSEQG